MIKITNITIKNFLSVGNATQAIRLDQNGLTLILGSNTDSNGGITRNGAGKSTILQAISFGLYGKPLTKIKVDNLVNNINTKGMIVSIEFEKDEINYRIERGRKPQILKWYVNGKENIEPNDEAQGENRHTQEEIERVLGMSHTMFLHVLALNTFTDPFLKLKVADQRVVIEELLGVMTLSQRAEVLKKLFSQTKEGIRDRDAEIKATLEANARIESNIAKLTASEQSWERQHVKLMDELVAEIEAVEKIDFEHEIGLFDALDAYQSQERDLKAKVASAQSDLDTVVRGLTGESATKARAEAEATSIDPDALVRRLDVEIGRKHDDAARHTIQADKLRAEIAGVVEDITHADDTDCRCCGQKLSGTDHLATVIANLEKQKATLVKKLDREEREIAARHTEVEEIDAEKLTTRASAEERRSDALRRAAEADDQLWRLGNARIGLTEAMDRANSDLRALGLRPVTTFRNRDEVYKAKQLYETLVRDLEQEVARTNPYSSDVEFQRGTIIEIDYQPLHDLQDLQKHQDLLLKLLTNKDSFIRKKIIDQNLNYLNHRLNHYLDKLGLPHEVRFEPDLSVDIRHLGRDFDFEQLSRGEMNRVIMATSWSFRDVWESLNEPVNLYFIDEVLDQGTDSHGAEAALGILKSMARERGKNVFLISHRDELVGQIDRTLVVRKEQGFSQFEEDTL